MAGTPEVVAVIPARYGSTRFPGKSLADLAGKPVIRHVYERVRQARSVDMTVVATDDGRIRDAVAAFGGEVVMTSSECRSGTDRVAEAARTTGGDVIVNVQGDEPLIDPQVIDAVVAAIRGDDGIVCSTAACTLAGKRDYLDPHVVKVVADTAGRALYFSRAPIPYHRDTGFEEALQHVGVYCFRADFLQKYAAMEETPLEQREKLEQLRILENGHRIGVVKTTYRSMGVDTPEDLARIRAFF